MARLFGDRVRVYRRRWVGRIAVLSAIVLSLELVAPFNALASPVVRVTSTAAPCGSTVQTHYRHVVWIVMENVGYSVVGSARSPFLNHLSAQCGLATNDFAVSHPSLPNYLALTSGSTDGVIDDGEPSAHRLKVTNIFSQLRGDWRAYEQAMPVACDRITSGLYAARHNPAVYYTNLSATCQRHDATLASSFALHAAFTFITPNICDDMHSCAVATGDAWLAKMVPMITSSSQYRSGSIVLFITFDENNTQSTNRVPLYVVAPSVPRGERVNVPLTHYSLLGSTERLLGLKLLRHAATARSLLALFHL